MTISSSRAWPTSSVIPTFGSTRGGTAALVNRRAKEEAVMYIGLGTVVFILIVVFIIYAARRA